MRRLRSSVLLLALCVVVIVVAWLKVATERPQLPAGSSYSRQPDGAAALYAWAEAEGSAPVRLEQARVLADTPPRVLLVLQPESVISERERRIFDAVARAGGTLVVAGDAFALDLYARELDISIESASVASSASTLDGSLTLQIDTLEHVNAADAAPLLVTPLGDSVAIRKPHLQGWVVWLTTAEPLSNAGLRDPAAARFVYRHVIAPSTSSGGLAFDEIHHGYQPVEAGAEEPSVNQLLFQTAPGQAAVAASVLTFVYLLLAGRRLGPPLPPRRPEEQRRTMFEHVQMLAGLYRRAGQLGTVRSTLSRHYTRAQARGTLSPQADAHLTEALAQIDAARSESELVSSVARADSAVSPP
jgi:hypothetical protein